MYIFKKQSGSFNLTFLCVIAALILLGWYGYKEWYPDYCLEQEIKQVLEEDEGEAEISLQNRMADLSFTPIMPGYVPKGYYLTEAAQEMWAELETEPSHDYINFDYMNKGGTMLYIHERVREDEETVIYLDDVGWDEIKRVELKDGIEGALARSKLKDTTTHPTADLSLTAVEERAELVFIKDDLVIDIGNYSLSVHSDGIGNLTSPLLSEKKLIKFANSFIDQSDTVYSFSPIFWFMKFFYD